MIFQRLVLLALDVLPMLQRLAKEGLDRIQAFDEPADGDGGAEHGQPEAHGDEDHEVLGAHFGVCSVAVAWPDRIVNPMRPIWTEGTFWEWLALCVVAFVATVLLGIELTVPHSLPTRLFLFGVAIGAWYVALEYWERVLGGPNGIIALRAAERSAVAQLCSPSSGSSDHEPPLPPARGPSPT